MRRAGETAPAARLADGSWQFTEQTITQPRSDLDILRQLALERCPPVTLSAPVATALIKNALGQPLTGGDTAALAAALADMQPANNTETAIKAAKSADAINTAAGGKLWPI